MLEADGQDSAAAEPATRGITLVGRVALMLGMRWYRQVALCGCLLTAVGCATAPTQPVADGTADSGHEHSRAESVFLYQSRVADALLDRYPLLDVFAGADPALVEAEAHMTEACSPLTQAVLATFEGEQPSLVLRWKVMNTIDECEQAARHTESLISDTAVSDAGPTI